MTNDQKKEAFSMLVDGATYTEVAEKFGVSRQRVNQIFGSVFGESVWEKDKYAKYPAISNFMREERISLNKLSERTLRTPSTVGNYLSGKTDIPKSFIDEILKITGMTYEEAFADGE